VTWQRRHGDKPLVVKVAPPAPFDEFVAAMREALPGAELDLRVPAEEGGHWWVWIVGRELHAVARWREVDGFEVALREGDTGEDGAWRFVPAESPYKALCVLLALMLRALGDPSP
jgi:hypothetical protein